MDRRTFLSSLTTLSAGIVTSGTSALSSPAAHAAPVVSMPTPALIAAWRAPVRLSVTGETIEAAPPTDYVGVLVPDWDAGRIRIHRAVAVPERVHGLVAGPDGGFYAVAYRPGKWLTRVDADGRVAQRVHLADETGGRTLDGHAVLSPDGRWLITTETAPQTGDGWISVRDRLTLARMAQWRTHGIEPHEARFVPVATTGSTPSTRLYVANGGILRAAGDVKRELDRMDSSLICLDIGSGELLGQWRAPDRRLSLRHLAFSNDGERTRVGVAIQAEHDDPAQRADAPILAVLNVGDAKLHIPSRMMASKGYCGDVVAGPNGGFYLSGERANRVFRWDPANPGELQVIAELERAGALAPWQAAGAGVLIGAARGMARWHPSQSAAMLRWPVPLVPDNHWAVTAAPA